MIIEASKLLQLNDDPKALNFEIPNKVTDRSQAIGRLELQFPHSFFEPGCQGMIHGSNFVGTKPSRYSPDSVSEWRHPLDTRVRRNGGWIDFISNNNRSVCVS